MSDAPQSRASFATISPTTPHDTGRKFTRPTRENQWVKKYGRKHHNYPAAKAPYPLSYDKDILDRDAIDMSVVQTVMCSPRSVAEQTPPQRVLDLGCGTGAWIIHTARNYWRDTEFVGFDLVNIQIPTVYLERQLAQRITWQHGNFLSQRLPFVDCYFDFVRIAYVASGVPENKWTVIFEEINRVLAPNGQVEVTEEDILFPIVPRWFTDPLRAKPRTRASSKASNVTMNGAESEALPPSPPNSPTSERTDFEPPPQDETHEHALLELLFVSLHESRFINMKPTNILPVYFTPFFSRCMQGPTLHFGMPFLTPLRPLPAVRQSIPTSDSSTRVESTIFARPPSTLATLIGQHSPTTEAPTLSVNPEFRRSSSFGTDSDASTRSPQDRSVTPTLTTPEPSVKGDDDDIWRNWVLPDPSKGGPWVTPTPEGQRDPNMLPGPALRGLSKFSSRARAVVLWHSYLGVRGCQEAMWEELLLLQGTQVGRKRLLDLGWVPSKPPDQPLSETMGELEQKDAEMKWEAEDRARFEEMFDVYERDIRARAAFWYSSTELGLPLPKREPLPKADLAEEERRRKAILDSRALLSKDDSDVPTKSVRTFVGYKITEGEETSAQNALSGMNGSLEDDL